MICWRPVDTLKVEYHQIWKQNTKLECVSFPKHSRKFANSLGARRYSSSKIQYQMIIFAFLLNFAGYPDPASDLFSVVTVYHRARCRALLLGISMLVRRGTAFSCPAHIDWNPRTFGWCSARLNAKLSDPMPDELIFTKFMFLCRYGIRNHETVDYSSTSKHLWSGVSKRWWTIFAKCDTLESTVIESSSLYCHHTA